MAPSESQQLQTISALEEYLDSEVTLDNLQQEMGNTQRLD